MRRTRAHSGRVLTLAAGRAAVCLGLALLVVGGCGRGRTASLPTPQPPPSASPVVRGADRGLEVWWWIVSDERRTPARAPEPGEDPANPAPPPFRIVDDRANIEALLLPYADRPLPMSEEMRGRWAASGFRIVRVPLRDLERIQAESRLVGQAQRQWLGEAGKWTEAARGPTLPERRAMRLHDGVLTLEAGRLRLLLRCWTVPIPAGLDAARAAMQLELSPQYEPAVSERERMAAAAGIGELPKPRMFSSLAASMLVTEEDAFVIVPDSPLAEWGAEAPETPAQPPEEFGPHPPSPPSLGELMFSSPATRTQARTRAVIVLVPRIPALFELLP